MPEGPEATEFSPSQTANDATEIRETAIQLQTNVVLQKIELLTLWAKKLVAAVAVGSLLSIMAASNPSKSEYIDFASDRLSNLVEQQLDSVEVCNNLHGNNFFNRNICENLLEVAKVLVGISAHEKLESLIDSVTLRHNFIFFSIYESNLGRLKQSDPTQITQIKTLGAFGNFWTFKISKGNS
ncbi:MULTISPECIES: DUF4359 domain-containing protein [Aerosakkonema]|uniref:DUF4359 domain-containing protein n=1 Tax=Aerosakkonema TaxID=1246629 RepID=UPI0035B9EF47